MDYLKLACDKLGIKPEQVMAEKLYDDHIAIVVNNGKDGCPKYTIPFADLEKLVVNQPEQPARAMRIEPASQPEPPQPEPKRRGRR